MQDTFVFFQLLGKVKSASELRFTDPLVSLLSINEFTKMYRSFKAAYIYPNVKTTGVCHWSLRQKATISMFLLVNASRSVLKTQLFFSGEAE